MSDANARRVLALVRVAVGVMFLFFAEYKIVGSEFVHGGFQKYVGTYIDQHQAVSWVRPILTGWVLPHPYLWARMVAWSELLIGISLVLGWFVRLSSLGGIALMLAITFASWYEPGHGVPYWRYLGAHLDNIPLAMLFLLLLVFNAGKTWGIDGGLKLPGR
jgi:thiosulfate dehydrogenase [quinone] large subunit